MFHVSTESNNNDYEHIQVHVLPPLIDKTLSDTRFF